MRKLIIIVIALKGVMGFTQTDHDVTVEDNVLGIQTGLIGIWGHYEKKLSSTIALRTELGLDFGFRKGIFTTNDEFVFAFIPNIRLEPRYYYSLKRRIAKDRSIDENSGSFLGLRIQYIPDLFTISNKSNLTVSETISFIPKYGFRKVWDNNLCFETGIGIGPILYLSSNNWDATAELTIRIGYNF